ncbi:MAG: DUF3108 domain-containing protein [Prolixibacteraceae bacterium]|jgi:hypothetical protein|nr:DUF3108 domain-containing protein [Prolixibacteraceae bacterium]
MKKYFILIFIAGFFTARSQPTERMEYLLRYGFIHGGEVILESNDTVFQSKKAVHHYLRARTTGIADKLYRVDDVYESIVDARTRLPLKSVRNIKERKYRYYNEIIFNNENDSIISKRSGTMVAPNNMVDILGLFFYMRRPGFLDQLKRKGTVEMPVSHDEDIFMMRVNYIGMGTIQTVLGRKECIVVAPVIKKGKVLERDDGLKFYITNDHHRLPVYMEFEMKIGAVKCELQEYQIKGRPQKR